MEAPSTSTHNNPNNCICCRELHPRNFSFKKFCFFLLIFLLISFIIIGLSTFFVILIMKPHKPVFSVRGVTMNFYEIDNDINDPTTNSNNLTPLVSSVLSLTLSAENHNKFGIGYGRTRFGVYHEDVPIGSIRIPRFFQPPHSHDVVVRSRVLLECVNVTRILARASGSDDQSKGNMAEIKILGDAKAHLWLLRINLLDIKLAIDCDMNVNLKELTSTNEVYSAKVIKSRLAYVLSNSKVISMKCVSTFSI